MEILNETWYQLHLSAWLVLLGCLIIHVLMGLKIGGTPLIMSMFRRQYRPSDSPRLWRQKIQEFIKSRKETRQ